MMSDLMIQLTGAVDFPAIVERLKAKGLDVTEDAVKSVTEELFLVAGETLQKAFPIVAPLLLPLLAPLKAAALKEIDKLDGKVG
jgi:hypothetical protein